MLSRHFSIPLLYWMPCLSEYSEMFSRFLINRAKIATLPYVIYGSDIICQNINSTLGELPGPISIPCTYFYSMGMQIFSNKSNRCRISNCKGVPCTKLFIAFCLKKAYCFFRMNERLDVIPKWVDSYELFRCLHSIYLAGKLAPEHTPLVHAYSAL